MAGCGGVHGFGRHPGTENKKPRRSGARLQVSGWLGSVPGKSQRRAVTHVPCATLLLYEWKFAESLMRTLKSHRHPGNAKYKPRRHQNCPSWCMRNSLLDGFGFATARRRARLKRSPFCREACPGPFRSADAPLFAHLPPSGSLHLGRRRFSGPSGGDQCPARLVEPGPLFPAT